MAEKKAPREQRPFHICPECSAYNAKFNKQCWRCSHDMTASAVEPKGIMGYRLQELDAASKDSPEKN